MRLRITYPLSERYAKKQKIKGEDIKDLMTLEVEDSNEICNVVENENALNFLVDYITETSMDIRFVKENGLDILEIDFRELECNYEIVKKELKLDRNIMDFDKEYYDEGIRLTSTKGYHFDEVIDIRKAIETFINVKKEEALVKKNIENERRIYIQEVNNFKKEYNERIVKEQERKTKEKEDRDKQKEQKSKSERMTKNIKNFFKTSLKDIIFIIMIVYSCVRIFLSGALLELYGIPYFSTVNPLMIIAFMVTDLIVLYVCLKSCYPYWRGDEISFNVFIGVLITSVGQLLPWAIIALCM